jgi:hypothetical protein
MCRHNWFERSQIFRHRVFEWWYWNFGQSLELKGNDKNGLNFNLKSNNSEKSGKINWLV